jgi:hypothetical protein
MDSSVAFEIAQRSVEGKPKISIKQRRSEDVIRAELKFLFELSSKVGREVFPYHCELEIEYQKEFKGIEKRRITANSLFMFSDQVYVNAFCHFQQKVRTFRRDRILSAQLHEGSELSVPPSSRLGDSDFFVHPKTWGDYRKPCAILVRKMMDKSVPKTERFRPIFKFAAQSLKRGVWSDFYKDGKAAGIAFLTLGTDVKGYNWQAELERMRGGRFDRSAFLEALASVDNFSSGKTPNRAMDAQTSSA